MASVAARPAYLPTLADGEEVPKLRLVEHLVDQGVEFRLWGALNLETVERLFATTPAALASAIEAMDSSTAAHSENVAYLAERVGLRMGLSVVEAKGLRYAAMLHDLGKIVVPSQILLKPAPLTDEEWRVMAHHVIAGGDLVARIDSLAHLAPAVRASHERWDGGGYPDGLTGEAIPLAARIIAACDTYDAIVTDRPYRAARSHVEAREELRRASGSQLEGCVVDALLAELG